MAFFERAPVKREFNDFLEMEVGAIHADMKLKKELGILLNESPRIITLALQALIAGKFIYEKRIGGDPSKVISSWEDGGHISLRDALTHETIFWEACWVHREAKKSRRALHTMEKRLQNEKKTI